MAGKEMSHELAQAEALEWALALIPNSAPEARGVCRGRIEELRAQASPAMEPVAHLTRFGQSYLLIDDAIKPEMFNDRGECYLYTAPPADERVKAFEQRAETAEHDLQILTTVVRTGYPPPRAIPMRESAEGAAKIAVERVERVKVLEELLQAALPYIKYPRDATDAFVIAHDKMIERIRAALEGKS